MVIGAFMARDMVNMDISTMGDTAREGMGGEYSYFLDAQVWPKELLILICPK